MTYGKLLRRSFRPGLTSVLLLTSLSLFLAACGDTPQVVAPPTTPTPSFRQETNQDLFFVMSVPVNWIKTTEKDSVIFTANDDKNVKLTVTTIPSKNLTGDSTRFLQEKLDALKVNYPELRQDNAGVLHFINDTVSLFQVSYTEGGVALTQYLAQVNAPLSERAYLLIGQTPTAKANDSKQVFISSFESFKTNAPLVVPATLTAGAGLGDPTALAASAGGKVTGTKTAPGKVTTEVEWQSPPLPYGSARFTMTGLFPQAWQWRVRAFPNLDRSLITATPGTPAANELLNPGLYLNAPDSEAFMQLGVVPNAFASETPPSVEEYNRAITPYLDSFKRQTINGLGSKNTVSDLTNVGPFFRLTFIARNDAGATNARGVVLFRSAGRHLIMGVVTLSPSASLKQNLIDGYDIDLQSIISSIKVTSPTA